MTLLNNDTPWGPPSTLDHVVMWSCWVGNNVRYITWEIHIDPEIPGPEGRGESSDLPLFLSDHKGRGDFPTLILLGSFFAAPCSLLNDYSDGLTDPWCFLPLPGMIIAPSRTRKKH